MLRNQAKPSPQVVKLTTSRLRKAGNHGILADKDFENLQDNIQFGERVDAPPTIALKKFPKTSANAGSKALILNRTLKNGGGIVKKKTQSMAQKVASERERLKVVAQYRQLKGQKW